MNQKLFMLFVWVALPGSALAEGSGDAPKAVSCVDVVSEARYRGLGYEHVVTLTSSCKKAVTCSVKTDVVPTPTTVELAQSESKSVVTLSGSAAREFRADVSCKEHD